MRGLFFALVLALSASSALASPYYRETFKLCGSLEMASKSAMDLTGWKAFKNDSSIGKIGFLKINLPGSPNHPPAYNSFPQGAEDGAAFWSKNVTGLTIFTDEFSFDLGNLHLVEYDQRLTGFDEISKLADGTQVAFLLENTWFISDQMVRQVNRGVWEPIAFVPQELTYGTSPNRNGLGPDQPGNFGIKLPQQGIITAFGVFLPKVNGRVRIDNFTLSDLLPDARTPGEQGTHAQCTDVIIPDDTNTPAGVGKFCKRSAAKRLGKIKASSSVKKRILLSITGNTLPAERDRAVLALLLSNNLRIDNLVNVAVRDYYSVGTLQLLNASGVTQQTKAIKEGVRQTIDQYLTSTGLAKKGALPLFQAIDSKTGHSNNSALCTNDLRKIVLQRAKRARLHSKIRILS